MKNQHVNPLSRGTMGVLIMAVMMWFANGIKTVTPPYEADDCLFNDFVSPKSDC